MIGPFELLTLALVGGGIVLLLLASTRAGKLLALTRRTHFARTWSLLRAFMIAFAASYLALAALVVAGAQDVLAGLTGSILFGGGLFVFLVTRSSHASHAALKDESLARSHVTDIFNALRDGLVVLDAKGWVISANRRIHEMVGADPGTLIGASATDLFGLAADVVGGMNRIREGTLQRREGLPLPVELRMVSIASADGSASETLLVVRDRSEFLRNRRRLERALKSAAAEMRARQEQSATMQAECGPLLAELREEIVDLSGDAAVLDLVDTLGRHLHTITAAEQSRAAGKRTFELADALSRASAVMTGGSDELRVDVSISAEVSRRYRGHEEALRDTLVSVGQYVISEDAPERVDLEVKRVPGDEQLLLFILRGRHRGGSSLAPHSVSGMSIGLAAARLRCSTLGGQLWESSREADQIEVSFTAALEAASAEARDEAQAASPLALVAAEASRSTRRPLVAVDAQEAALIVDDDPIAREILGRLVSDLGYDVDLAASGEACRAKAAARSYDLILLDLVLPDANGIDLLADLRARETTARASIIVISAIDATASVAACLERGADDYLTKPVNPVIFRARHHVIHENRVLSRQASRHVAHLEDEIQRADGLLRAILPEPIARELQTSGSVRARRYPDVVVFFADIVGFTRYCDGRPPEEILVPLQELVIRFEELCKEHAVLKIKTVGDALMACGGLMDPPEDAPQRCVELAFGLLAALDGHPEGWTVRIGMHRGPVVGGVVGDRQFSFDVWGDTVNTAARIESNGLPGEVCVSEALAEALPDAYATRRVGVRELKGKGSVAIYAVSPAEAGAQRLSQRAG
ncbi:MAG: response regulator [Myxococcales bacterium]|nr:response regulator [Myxococcales bacterium]